MLQKTSKSRAAPCKVWVLNRADTCVWDVFSLHRRTFPQVDALAAKSAQGHQLDDLQVQKLSKRESILASIAALEQTKSCSEGKGQQAKSCSEGDGTPWAAEQAALRPIGEAPTTWETQGTRKAAQEKLVAVGIGPWEGLRLDRRVCDALYRLGFSAPTSIQNMSILAIGAVCLCVRVSV